MGCEVHICTVCLCLVRVAKGKLGIVVSFLVLAKGQLEHGSIDFVLLLQFLGVGCTWLLFLTISIDMPEPKEAIRRQSVAIVRHEGVDGEELGTTDL